MSRRSTESRDALLGPIHADAVYAEPDFRRRTGLGPNALRKAYREGLVAVKIGELRQIHGADWIEFVTQRAADGGHRG